MISHINVKNSNNITNTLYMKTPEVNGIGIENIEGIGDLDANINFNTLVNLDGGKYTSSRVDPRNIDFTFVLLPNPTIEETRHIVYKLFPTKSFVTLEFVTDIRTVYISGYVSAYQSDIFSDKETMGVTIECMDPYFYGGKVTSKISLLEDYFEFPFENTLPMEPTIEFGKYTDTRVIEIDYIGDVITGIEIFLRATDEISNPKIINATTNEIFTINTDYLKEILPEGIINGDTIYINTNPGQKKITLSRDGITYNIINAIEKSTPWLWLAIGTNIMSYKVDDDASKLECTISYDIKYGGV